MNRLKTILLGTDFSPCSTAAVHQATRMAHWNNASLRAVHVLDVLMVREFAEAFQYPLMLMERDAAAETSDRLNGWLASAGVNNGIEAETVIGMPLDVILKRVTELDTNLLVLGLRGDSTAHQNAGNLALKCLRKAPTKVMLVHENHAGPFRDVVACVDFSPSSREVIEQALRVGEQDQSCVHFVHVHSDAWRQFGFHVATLATANEYHAQYLARQEERLRTLVGDTRGLKVQFVVRQSSNVSQGLVQYAQSVSAGLLVLGNKGVSNLKYVLLGATVERLLREVPCSVLVVRPTETGDAPKGESTFTPIHPPQPQEPT